MFEKAGDIIPNLLETIMEHKDELKTLAFNSTSVFLCLPGQNNCVVRTAIVSSRLCKDPILQSWLEKSMILYNNEPNDRCLETGNMAAELFK